MSEDKVFPNTYCPLRDNMCRSICQWYDPETDTCVMMQILTALDNIEGSLWGLRRLLEKYTEGR